jgi:hypothetical protein
MHLHAEFLHGTVSAVAEDDAIITDDEHPLLSGDFGRVKLYHLPVFGTGFCLGHPDI